MRPHLTMASVIMMLSAHSSLAGQWHSSRSSEGGFQFVLFYNDTGFLEIGASEANPNQIAINKSDDVNDFGQNGSCNFDNCEADVYINGRAPNPHEDVKILFSNGFELNFQHSQKSEDALLSNYYASSMGAMNYFDEYIRTNEWVEICLSSDCYRFDLSGSAHAANQIWANSDH